MTGTEGEFENLAYEAALRGLDKQERLLEELRARTGVLLAAASLAPPLLGRQAFLSPAPRALALTVLGSFVASIGSCIYVLLPKELVFSEDPARLYDGLYDLRDEMVEVHRRLAYDLNRFWDSNDETVRRISRACSFAAAAFVIEVFALAALLAGQAF